MKKRFDNLLIFLDKNEICYPLIDWGEKNSNYFQIMAPKSSLSDNYWLRNDENVIGYNRELYMNKNQLLTMAVDHAVKNKLESIIVEDSLDDWNSEDNISPLFYKQINQFIREKTDYEVKPQIYTPFIYLKIHEIEKLSNSNYQSQEKVNQYNRAS